LITWRCGSRSSRFNNLHSSFICGCSARRMACLCFASPCERSGPLYVRQNSTTSGPPPGNFLLGNEFSQVVILRERRGILTCRYVMSGIERPAQRMLNPRSISKHKGTQKFFPTLSPLCHKPNGSKIRIAPPMSKRIDMSRPETSRKMPSMPLLPSCRHRLEAVSWPA
jgi:hypothetical protein